MEAPPDVRIRIWMRAWKRLICLGSCVLLPYAAGRVFQSKSAKPTCGVSGLLRVMSGVEERIGVLPFNAK